MITSTIRNSVCSTNRELDNSSPCSNKPYLTETLLVAGQIPGHESKFMRYFNCLFKFTTPVLRKIRILHTMASHDLIIVSLLSFLITGRMNQCTWYLVPASTMKVSYDTKSCLHSVCVAIVAPAANRFQNLRSAYNLYNLCRIVWYVFWKHTSLQINSWVNNLGDNILLLGTQANFRSSDTA